MNPRKLLGASVLIFATLLAGCGSKESAPPGANPSPSHTSATRSLQSSATPTRSSNAPQNPPAIIAAAPPSPTILTPTKVIQSPANSGTTQNYRLTAPLIPGTGLDSLAVTFSHSGGTLTVMAQGRTVWTVPHVATVSVAEYGSKHPPVILTGSDQDFCGTGGCTYNTYTYDPSQSRFVTVPIDPWHQPTYRWLAGRAAWQEIPNAVGLEGPGGASLTSTGLATSNKLYNATMGMVSSQFRYGLDGHAAGEWVPYGRANFGPDALGPLTPFPASSLGQAAAEYYEELMENHPLAASKFVAPSASAEHLLAQNQIMRTWGVSGTADSHDAVQISPDTWKIPLWTTRGFGPSQHLEADVATVEGTQINSGWYLTATTLTASDLKVPTVKRALRQLQESALMQDWIRQHPNSVVTINPGPQGMHWQATFSEGTSTSLQLEVNVVTGSVTDAPSNS